MKVQSILLLLIGATAIFSCKAPTDVVYFQDTKNLEQVKSRFLNGHKTKPFIPY